jgi:hypothetical protein
MDRTMVRVGGAVAIFLPVIIGDDQLTFLDELPQHFIEQPPLSGIPPIMPQASQMLFVGQPS